MAKSSGGTRASAQINPTARMKMGGGGYQLNGKTYTVGNYFSDAENKEIINDFHSMAKEAGAKIQLSESLIYDPDTIRSGKKPTSNDMFKVPAASLTTKGKDGAYSISFTAASANNDYQVNCFEKNPRVYGDSSAVLVYSGNMGWSGLVTLMREAMKNKKIIKADKF